MKKLLSITLLFLTSLTQAQVLSAPSVIDLIKTIEEAKFSYKGRGKIFGYNTTQSCLYVSPEIAIFKNYCYPVKNYPARGFTILSKEFGMIDLYEEKLSDVLKRDIQITQFPEVLGPYLSTRFPETSVEDLSYMLEKLYYGFHPGCWSTNFGFDSGIPEVSCTDGSSVMNFEAWASETQQILVNESSWALLMSRVEAILP